MADESIEQKASAGWKTAQVYAMAGICLVVGLLLGYLFRGSESAGKTVASNPATVTSTPPASAPSGMDGMPSLDQMKQMADKQAAPLLEQLKTDPRNSSLLNQVGTIYKLTHQFSTASEYYKKSVEADPKNLGARTELASCLYYQGDADGALAQLEQVLRYDPRNASALFNLGMIRWQAKNDAGSAVTAWQQLLKSNPKLPNDRKAEVEKLIAQAKKHSGGKLQANENNKER